MASYHYEIKSGKKGAALDHAKYINRDGTYRDRDEVIWAGFGNLPAWSHGDPHSYWRAADKYERMNGATYREHIIALPTELNLPQQQDLVAQYVNFFAGNKPYQFAVHSPRSCLTGEDQPHLHLMISDRIPDQYERPPDLTFRRYNAADPISGGRKKDSGGRNPLQLRDQLLAQRATVAEMTNVKLAESGHDVRVDHRSHRERGITRPPERHLGSAIISHMSEEEKKRYLEHRAPESSVD